MDLSGGTIVFTSGDLAYLGAYRGIVSTQLMLVPADSSIPGAMSRDGYGVKIDDGRIAWMEDLDLTERKCIWRVDDEQPQSVAAAAPFPHLWRRSLVGGGLVSWSGEGLNLWRVDTGAAARVEPGEWEEMAGGTLSGGWFTWWGGPGYESPESMYGIPIDAIPLD